VCEIQQAKPGELAQRHEENIKSNVKGQKTVEVKRVSVFFRRRSFWFLLHRCGVSKSFCCVHCAAKQHLTVAEESARRKRKEKP
jgi:hypothetical protein